jgi:hypothetical protein
MEIGQEMLKEGYKLIYSHLWNVRLVEHIATELTLIQQRFMKKSVSSFMKIQQMI